MTEYLSKTEEVKQLYSRIRSNVSAILNEGSSFTIEELKKIKEASVSAERDCLEDGINPDKQDFWYKKTISLLYAFEKIVSKRVPEYDNPMMIRGFLTSNGCSSENADVIFREIKRKKSLEEQTLTTASI